MVGIRDLFLVNSLHVVNQVRFYFWRALLHLPFEFIGLRCLVFGECESINLVGLGVIFCQNSLTVHGVVVGVEQVADVSIVLSIFLKLVDEFKDCPLLDEL